MKHILLSQNNNNEQYRSIHTCGEISEGSKVFSLPNLLQMQADVKSHHFKYTEKYF